VERKPPQPLAQSFLLCRDIFQDRQTGEYLLIAPYSGLALPAFPAAFPVSLYIRLTGGHGTYRLNIQVRDEEGQVVGEILGAEPIPSADPLTACQICWRNLGLHIPRPGRYDLVLLANGEDLAHHSLEVALRA